MDEQDRVPERSDLPVRVFRLGAEPKDDLRDVTTPEQRLDMVRDLSERMWELTGRPAPRYQRSDIPVRMTRLA